MTRLIVAAVALIAVSSSTPLHGQSPPAAGVARPAPAAQAQPARPGPTSTLPNDKDSVKFLVIGDTGTGDS